jgi:hypothetical protein
LAEAALRCYDAGGLRLAVQALANLVAQVVKDAEGSERLK